ncbi:MAG: hypothetical protein JSV03_06120 [Planctomycetota bacterium]|nr:MAG: hypothetical protein JSV03_06120 [Planctomycetota bacterium]
MLRRYTLLCVIFIIASPAMGQNIIFEDNFDGYGGGGYLSAIAELVWTKDGCTGGDPARECYDGKVSDDLYNSETYAVEDWKIGCGDPDGCRIGIRNRHDLTTAEMMNATVVRTGPGGEDPNCVIATDTNPLILNFHLNLGSKQTSYYERVNRYVEVTCGADRAPTPMNMVYCGPGATDKPRHFMNLDGDGLKHGSIAVGQIAFVDQDPCSGAPDAERQENYRLAVYDGRQWHYISGGDTLHTCSKVNEVTVEIRANDFTVTIENKYDPLFSVCWYEGPLTTSSETYTREYTGPFSSIVMGGIPNEQDGGCWDKETDDGYLNMPGTSALDNLRLAQGEAEYQADPCATPGACCTQEGPGYGTCSSETEDYCVNTIGGTWLGPYTTCGTNNANCNFPCYDPYADWDNDDDVDQDDFAQFQACFTGSGGGIPTNCLCFDKVGDGLGTSPDGDIDQDDYEAFQLCASGPTIPANTACDD